MFPDEEYMDWNDEFTFDDPPPLMDQMADWMEFISEKKMAEEKEQEKKDEDFQLDA